ncbi:hypothetical protein [Nocardioides sp. GY 10127]|uniref:hypothetical protein n=1 Tax=Nocardioides sp. GY 10127 TaxID=2569762 RepID=UPI0010A80EE9|nr:hypothetical protein [Nocardioides sp. GY 10127]TIC83308.1 hypothetical protein E8D37_07100 [Nocardioides sp. GY 10127]
MTAERPQRVRVTGPPRRRPPRPRTREVDAESRLGSLYVRALVREQLWLGVRTLGVLAIGLGTLPLLFWALPWLAGVRLLGIALPWWLLGVVPYPLLVLAAWRFVWRAERNEDTFAELLRELDDER